MLLKEFACRGQHRFFLFSMERHDECQPTSESFDIEHIRDNDAGEAQNLARLT